MTILDDHIKRKKRMVTPFNNLGNIEESDWIGNTMPNLIWISLLNKKLGIKAGAEVVAHSLKCITDNQPESLPNDLHLINSHYEFTCSNDTISLLKQKRLYEPLRSTLNDFLFLYPECPIKTSLSLSSSQAICNQDSLAELKSLLFNLYDKTSEESTFTLATAVYAMFVCDKLTVTSNVSLARFPEIVDYPRTEISRKIASSLRCVINVPAAETNSGINPKKWSTYFWNCSYQKEPIRL